MASWLDRAGSRICLAIRIHDDTLSGAGDQHMPVIKVVRAPDLSDLYVPLLGNYILNKVFVQGGSRDRKTDSYVVNMIHNTDKALREYSAGRELLIKYVASSNRMMLYLEAVGHFENCINGLKRALRFVERIGAGEHAPEVDRIVRKLLENYSHEITPVRDAIEHMDAALDSGEVKEGDVQLLSVSDDDSSLEIAAHRLTFDRLASLLRRLHGLATELAAFGDEKPPSPSSL